MKQRQQSEVLILVYSFGRYVPVLRTKLLQLPAGNNCVRHTDDGGSKSFQNMVTIYMALTFMGLCIVIIF
jgi:hypothetical protein